MKLGHLSDFFSTSKNVFFYFFLVSSFDVFLREIAFFCKNSKILSKNQALQSQNHPSYFKRVLRKWSQTLL